MIEAIALIDEKIAQILRRPKMYSSSSESLEVTLLTLESLREQMIEDEASATHDLSEFFTTKGFSAMSMTTFAQSKGMTDVDDLYEFVTTSWKEFLSIHQRPF